MNNETDSLPKLNVILNGTTIDKRILDLTSKLEKLFSGNAILSDDSKKAFILYKQLEALCESFNDFYFVVSKVNSRGGNRNHFIKFAANKASSIEEICKIVSFIPPSWKKERKLLLKKGINFDHSKKSIIELLSKFDLI